MKDAGRRLTNNAQAGPAETLLVKAHKKFSRGKLVEVKEHTRQVGGKSETEQLLELSAMRKALRSRVLTAAEQTGDYQRILRREAASKAAMRLKLERDLDKLENRGQDHLV